MKYIIRLCEPKDMTKLINLCEQHALYERASYTAVGKKERLEKAIFGPLPRLFCLVVESGQAVVGYASYTFDFSTWEAAQFLYLDCLYLEPAYRGHRIGEAIMQQLIIIAQNAGCVNIQWQTPDFNEGAIRFYKKIGAEGKKKVRFSLLVRPSE